MDHSHAYYWVKFREAFLGLKEQAFEDWFCRLAEFVLRTDFERVRAYGRDGDHKADGRSLSDRAIYQCYAPYAMDKARLWKKIETDFRGALRHWKGWMKRWVFVHNDTRGLPSDVLERLRNLRDQYPEIEIEVWSEAELAYRLFLRLDPAGLVYLFGPAPDSAVATKVGPSQIAEVVHLLEEVALDFRREPIRPPSVDKIDKNGLSEQVRVLLSTGRAKDHVVRRHFQMHPSPDSGDGIVEGFRSRYRELKAAGKSPDEIFFGLQQYVGLSGGPDQQVAALAVLSYLFDRCDIFEDPDSEASVSS